MLRINMWSGPRNVSTALMYSFAQRADTTVVDEPFYSHYLTQSGADHPGKEEVIASQFKDATKVIEEVILANYPTPVVFFKQMTHHFLALDPRFLTQTRNVLLIRDPRYVIQSFAKVIERPVLADIGIVQQWEIYRHLLELGQYPLIIDGHMLRNQPEKILEALCEHLEIDFDPAMLAWKAGPRPEDGVWAKYWYSRVHQSTSFAPFTEQAISLEPKLEVIATEAQVYYDKLFEKAMHPGA